MTNSNNLGILFSLVPAIIHVSFFAMESLFWGHPMVNKIFRVKPMERVEHTRLFAFNQGFHNLFLALAIFTGTAVCFFPELGFFSIDLSQQTVVGKTLVCYALASMIAAGLVLLISTKNIRGAMLQALPPAIALGLLFFD